MNILRAGIFETRAAQELAGLATDRTHLGRAHGLVQYHRLEATLPSGPAVSEFADTLLTLATEMVSNGIPEGQGVLDIVGDSGLRNDVSEYEGELPGDVAALIAQLGDIPDAMAQIEFLAHYLRLATVPVEIAHARAALGAAASGRWRNVSGPMAATYAVTARFFVSVVDPVTITFKPVIWASQGAVIELVEGRAPEDPPDSPIVKNDFLVVR